MSEPAFIPSSEPFKVTMPEGSTVARSQSAKVGDDVRRVLADDDFLNVEDTHSDHMGNEANGGIRKDKFANADKSISQNTARLQNSGGLNNSSFVSGTGASSGSAKNQSSKLNSPEAQAAALAADSKEEERLAMLEMNFPARIVHLKIENDSIREQLNDLNAQMKP